MNKTGLLFYTVLMYSALTIAQVPVSQEPLHKPVLQNKYVRVLDVIIQPGDTSQFHIHETPSLFVNLSNTKIGSQIIGEDWVEDKFVAGVAWYKSFSPEVLIHRVSNWDHLPLHVNDIEILSTYNLSAASQIKPLQFPLLFENEKAFAYQLTRQNIKQEIIKSRGPLIAELVTGEGISFFSLKTRRSSEIKAGQFFYIEPETSFYFSSKGASEINMIVFEIK